MIETATNLDSLIPFVRLKIGDIDSTSYRYIDAWIRTALVASVSTLTKWWNYKYLLDSDYNIYRNPNTHFNFDQATYGIIEPGDDMIITLMASIIMVGGSLENAAWDYGSWRDSEISYSNIESSRARQTTLDRLWKELEETLKPPQKRLIKALKQELPGYLNNAYERSDKY